MPQTKIVFYKNSRGEKVVQTFITSLNISTIAKISHSIDLLEYFGYQLGMPHIKQLTSNLYELRVRGRQEVRLFYTYSQSQIVLLHGFIKKTQSTPKKELTIAQTRLNKLK